MGLILTGAQLGRYAPTYYEYTSGYLSASSPDPRDAGGNLQPNSFKGITIWGAFIESCFDFTQPNGIPAWENSFILAFKGSKIPDFNSVRITGEGIDYTFDKDKAETAVQDSFVGVVWDWPKFNTKNEEKLIGKYRISFN